MFSLVTKEVRLVTKNMQRPYKYASLESIVCITGSCSNKPHLEYDNAGGDIVQEAEHTKAESLQIALQTNNPAALEAYLESYPEVRSVI